MATDSSGYAHIAYTSSEAGLFYATNATGSWTTRPIATTGYEWQPRIGIDGAGSVHIVFTHLVDTEYEGIYHATNAGGSWYVELLLADNLLENGVDMKMTADGAMHLAWGGSPVGYSGMLFYAKYASGLLTVTNISTTQRAGRSGATLAIAPNGSAWVAYESSVSGNCGIEVLTNNGGSWHVAASGVGGCFGNVPTLGVEADGKVHVLWWSSSNFDIIDTYADGNPTGSFWPSGDEFAISFSPAGVPALLVERTNSGNHSLAVVSDGTVPDQVITNSAGTVPDEVVYPNAIAVDTAGKRHVVYSDTAFSPDHLVYATDVSGSFVKTVMDWPVVGEPAPVTTPLSAPAFYGRLSTDGSVPIVTNWAPTTAGSIGFDLQRSTEDQTFLTVASPTAATWSQSLMSGKRYQHAVRSRYDGGATSVWVTDKAVTLARIEETATNTLTFTGTWTRVAQAAASGGGVRTTKTPGSAVSITTSARSVSLVATTGRKMALVNVYVNGVLVKTIDLKRAENNITRRVVWVGQFTTTAVRTIKFVAVKKGTRVRVDFDAVIAFI
ncbi:MAG: hypothetical protein QOJ81_2368 [Chloroflexota bacterium]|jgi:hypothetical protein|nr:hypothetical protein [Chloroflexota bacterium]